MADPDASPAVEAANGEGASPGATEPLAVIEISEDGSWETKPLPLGEPNATAVDAVEEVQPDFLTKRDAVTTLENVKIKHVTRAHSSQYYVHCPVASVKPMVQETQSNGKGSTEAGLAKATTMSEALVNGGEIEPLKIERSTSGALMNGGVNAVDDVGCQEPSSVVAEEATAGDNEISASTEEFTAGGPAEDEGGVVVTESIIENKEKTKSYWEEMMLAAASASSGSPPRATPRGSEGAEEGGGAEGGDSAEEGGVAGAEGECLPAATVPKIVEAVAKRSEGGAAGEEEEETAAAGRRAAWARSETPAELKIAIELREMREREEELRRLRQELGLARGEEGASEGGEDGVPGGRDDSALHSIPTTDEGNFSECGAEDKEASEDKGNNDTMSPDMPSLETSPENDSYVHHRTQSMDSTSSGHSSASGGQRAGSEYPSRRRHIVKSFTNAEDDQNFREAVLKDENTMNLENQSPSSPFWGLKETPIEREIRISREREEELRREKGLAQLTNQTTMARPEALQRSTAAPVTPTGKGPQSVQLRLATSRIQREIQETTEREKELREAGKIQTMSEDTVDSKVTRIGERMPGSGVMYEKKIHKSVSAFQVGVLDPPPSATEGEMMTMSPPPPTVAAKPQVAHNAFTLNRSISVGAGLGVVVGSMNASGGSSSPRRFTPTSGQKGLMERFLASRGKLTCITPFNSPSSTSSSSPSTLLTPSSSNSSSTAKSTFNPIHLGSPMAKNVSNTVPVVHKPLEIVTDIRQGGESGVVEAVHRRGWTSAEEKIQEELKEMKMREDELRMQRAHLMAQSQPNLLSIMDEVEEGSQWNEDVNKLPSLYSTLSNPSLLDLDGDSPVQEMELSQEQAGQKSTRRKKSSLIVHWENRIQKNN